MKNASGCARGETRAGERDSAARWASGLTLAAVVAVVLMACGADTWSNAGAGGAAPSPAPQGNAPGRTPAIGAASAPVAPALRASFIAARQKEGGPEYRFQRATAGAATGKNTAQQIDVALADGALGVNRSGNEISAGWHLGLRWSGLGRGASVAAVAGPSAAAGVTDNRGTYLRADGSEEWYVSGPLGVEQGFVLPAAPGGAHDQALALEVSVDGDLSPALASDGSNVDLRDARGTTVAHYTDLEAVDASGAILRSWIEVDGRVVRLRVEDAGARYPLTIDPVVWTLQQEVDAPTPAAGDFFGYSVSVSGSLAIIGAPNHSAGAGTAYVFLQTGTTWALQQQLTAGDAAAGDGFGTSVAVSGTLAIVGAPNHKVGNAAGAGAAYLFTQSGVTWTQASEVTASDAAAADGFGTSVSISSSTKENAAIVGSPNHTVGAAAGVGTAYVFVQNGATWPQQAELVSGGAAGDAFGTSVSITSSATGASAVVGAPYHTVGSITEAGAAYAFAQSGTTWPLQTTLFADNGADFDGFGTAVSVSGTNAIVGAPYHKANGHSEAGGAYAFVQSAGAWTLQQDLTASDGKLGDLFGFSVSVSGTSAIIGAYQHDVAGTESAGAAYLFFQTCPTWVQSTELTASDDGISDFFGYAVGVSATTAIVGAYDHNETGAVSAGAAYLYAGVSSALGCCINGTAYAAGTVDPASVCQVCTPATSTATWSNEPDDTTCPGGVCLGGACASDCFIGGVVYSAGTVNPANSCQVCTPATSTTTWSSGANGTTCNDGNSCTQTDTCQNGTCTGSNPVTCTPLDQCHSAGTCSPATGVCSNPVATNGTSCNDGNSCTQTDTCQSGTCTGSNPVTCTPLDQCHVAGTCNPSTGQCSNPITTNGTSCSDGNACTQTDSCQNGTCTGSNPVTCTPLDQCHVAGTCSPVTGTCSNPTATNGTSCNDGNACTQTDTCQAGTCTGSNPVTCTPLDQCHSAGTCSPATGVCSNPNASNGTACNDGNACTQTDTCQAGTCTGANPVTCAPLDQCHVAGTCSPVTGTCSNPPANNGTACNDGNACTQTDSCQAGICLGTNPVVCTASDQCHAAGVCDLVSGVCTNPFAPNGTTCNDGNACTSTDVCTAGTCGGTAFTCTPTACQISSTCNGTSCTIVDQPSGTTCPDDGNPCTSDTCNATGTCTHPSLGDGTSCGAGEVCSSGTCSTDCFIGGVLFPAGTVDPANACLVCTPATSTTAWSNIADGTVCDDGNACTSTDVCTAGTCGGTAFTCTPTSCQLSSTCNGTSCTIVDQPLGTTCPSNGNPCDSNTCDGVGTCTHPALPDGTSCGSGELCQNGSCGAQCEIGGVFYGSGTINPANACQACAPATSTTAWSNVTDGTTCNDGNACTSSDVCTAGTCAGTAFTCTPTSCQASSTCNGTSCTIVNKGAGVACPSNGNPCDSNACDGAGTCAHPALPDGTSCGAGELCMSGSCGAQCEIGGVFFGSGTVNPANPCQVCAPATSTTAWSNGANGTACSDGNACTQTDTCQAGACVGTNPVVCSASDQCHAAGTCDPTSGACSNPAATDGTTCNDGNACTQTDACMAGICTGSNPVTCTALDPCHAVGTCDMTTGACTNPAATDGTTCNDGNACTQTDTCVAGTCTGANPVVCAASDPCHAVGTCDMTTGACSNPAATDGTTCSDGNGCTTLDTCMAGACVGGPAVVCTASDECHVAGSCAMATGQCSNPTATDGTACTGGMCESGVCTPSGTSSSSSSSSSTSSSSGTGTGGSPGTGGGGSTSTTTSGAGGAGGGTTSSSSGSAGGSPSGFYASGGACAVRGGTTPEDAKFAGALVVALALGLRRRRAQRAA